ncbi:MAG TPA: sigma-70 family RNA polymerase sigma factor [Kofleriaceae bacterium]
MTGDFELLTAASTEAAAAPDFSEVYDAWFRAVFRWVSALGGPRADVEDLVQEVFVIVQRKLAGFDGKNLVGWLYRITERTVRDYRRRAWYRNIFLRPREIVLDDLPANDASSAELLEQRQTRARFYAIVARMNRTWRDSFVLFEVQGYSGEEIATLRGIPSATVRTHLHRARKEFLALVAKEELR